MHLHAPTVHSRQKRFTKAIESSKGSPKTLKIFKTQQTDSIPWIFMDNP